MNTFNMQINVQVEYIEIENIPCENGNKKTYRIKQTKLTYKNEELLSKLTNINTTFLQRSGKNFFRSRKTMKCN